MTNYETQLINIIKNDEYIISILKSVEKLNLNDAWVAAGLIRNKVWDVLHNINTPINDIDVIYFDNIDTSWETEKDLEKKLEILIPNQPWTVKNQARMHLKNGFDSYNSSFDGVAHFTEIPTAIAVKICNSELKIMAPYGLDDLFKKIVKPTPYYQNNSKLRSIYIERMQEKKWHEIWIDLSVEV
ncbi:nucleotidyltransferase family protein [Sporosarcina sp. resist]|uniref:nucleotidyltransferase family protein n=1 Tax=Sporosarcina sp. resist TaxID=2762563 RepID=UPI00164D0436|nr:nucleotidyltransferase family protein [Sporosarcina sp. resist]QNK89578.1 nucleotidyltransferase family protein [Sporosarcina sp. resist]